MISAIVAVDYNWGIGFNGDLLEHIPEDLKYFKQLTTGNVVIMGRKTWDSLPNKPLSNRLNIVITSQKRENKENVKFMSIQEAKQYAIINRPTNIFIIGGGQIYKEFISLCKKIYVTKIFKEHQNIDTYFPNLDEMNNWILGECSTIYSYKDFTYQFCQYDKYS